MIIYKNTMHFTYMETMQPDLGYNLALQGKHSVYHKFIQINFNV